MKHFIRRAAALLLGLLLAGSFSACGAPQEAGAPVSPKPESFASSAPAAVPEAEPVVIHLYGSLDEPYLPFLERLQELFPEAELRYEFQWDTAGTRETERRLLHGDGPDLVAVSMEDRDALARQGLLLDLTSQEFSTRYHVSAMDDFNEGGTIHFLPLPNDLRCLACNMTVLERCGIRQPPKTVPELLELCEQLQSQGQKALLVNDELYYMLLRTSYLCKPAGYDWLAAYNRGESAMAGTPAADAWERLAGLTEAGGCSPLDASAVPARQTTLLATGEYAFRVTTLSNIKNMQNREDSGSIAALPLLGETEKDQWVYYDSPDSMRFFAANAELDRPENLVKKEIVLRMLDWISTQEGQVLLASCGTSAVTFVDGVKLEQGEAAQYLLPVMEQGHVTDSESFERGVGGVIGQCVRQLCAGEITPDQAVSACDEQHAAYSPPEEEDGSEEIVGSAEEDILWRKPSAVTVGSPMTQLAAQAMAAAFPEADFSFAMAKNTASSLYAGDITLGDVLACAEGEQDSELVLIRATGKQIRDVLDAGVGSAGTPELVHPYGLAGAGRLLHPVGLTYRADASLELGKRITELVLADGGTLDDKAVYTVAASSLLVDVVAEPNFSGCETVPTGSYLKDVLADYIRDNSPVSAPEVKFQITGGSVLYELP